MILRPPKRLLVKRTMTIIFIIMVMMTLKNVNGKPQDAGIFEKVASQAILLAGNKAAMLQDVAMISKNMAFDLPFAKVNSETKAGTGAALRNNNEDNDSSEEDRRKRSIEFQIIENDLIDKKTLHQHLHRGKRSPCHSYGGGTGGGEGGGGTPSDDDIDAARRLRAYVRKRMAASKKAKSKKTTTNSRRKKLINDNEEENQVLTRRKRQSEVDDLNQTMQNAGNSFAQQAQQIIDKIHNTFQNLMTSMNDMVQKVQKHFSSQNSTNNMEI